MGDSSAKIEEAAPAVSVLLPVRNGARTIRGAVRSILDQTFTNFELIVLDDGSTDDTFAVLSSLQDPRLRILRDGKSKGLATRLNEGIALATGTYVARMDADDFSFPSRFEKQVAFLKDHQEVDLCGTRALVFADDGHVLGLLPFRGDHAALTSQVWRNIPLPHPSWMGRAAWFRAHTYRLPEVLRAEDQELLLRAAPSSQYACLPDILLAYRQMDFGLSKTLLARKELLAAQVGLFVKRGEGLNVALAVFITAVKVCLDLLAALPRCQSLFFARMKGEAVPAESMILFESILKESGESRSDSLRVGGA